MTSVGIEVVDYLKAHHTTEDGAIKANDLCVLFNITNRELRNVVNGLRQDGEAVCSSSYGYWYSTNPTDLRKTIHRMEGQVRNMNNSITGLKGLLVGGEE